MKLFSFTLFVFLILSIIFELSSQQRVDSEKIDSDLTIDTHVSDFTKFKNQTSFELNNMF